MNTPAIVFFSHSSRDSARAEALAKAIDATGDARTTIDLRDLRDGALWREQLYRWIARCDAGFVLLTPAVMDKPGWVLQEAVLLRARKVYEGDRFPLFVRLEPGVTEHATWKTFFEPLALTEIEKSTQPLDDDVAKAVADECRRQGLAGRTDFFSMLRSQFAPVLEPLLKSSEAAKQMQARLHMDDERWRKIVGDDAAPAGALAQRLCDARTDTRIGSFNGLDDLFEFLRGQFVAEPLAPLLGLLRPYWVYLGAALQLAGALQRAPGHRIAALPTTQPALAPLLHLERVFSAYRRPLKPFELTAGNDSIAELTRQFIDAWVARYPRQSRPADATALNHRIGLMNVLQVVVLPPQTVPHLARAFAATFPLVGTVVPVDGPVNPAEWAGIPIVEPVRDGDQEEALVYQFDAASQYA